MPFKSDKQRRFLWSQKPEVARQIAYKQYGGPLADFDAWTDVEPEKQTHQAAINAALDFTPVLGDIKAFKEAETPLDYGLATAGLVPGLGDLAPVAKPLLAATPFFARAKGAGTFAKNPVKVKSINPKWDPNNPEHQLAAQSIGDDAARIVGGEAEDTLPSAVFKDFEVGGTGKHGELLDPNDLVEYNLPSKAKWDEVYPDVPYPNAPPVVQVAHNPREGLVAMSSIPRNELFDPEYRRGIEKFTSKAGPHKGETAKGAIGRAHQALQAKQAIPNSIAKLQKQAATDKGLSAKQEKQLQSLISDAEAAEDYDTLDLLSNAGFYRRGGRVGPLGRRL